MSNKTYRIRGHLWTIEGKSSLGDNYISIRRKYFMADLKKHGRVATVIDIPIDELQTGIQRENL